MCLEQSDVWIRHCSVRDREREGRGEQKWRSDRRSPAVWRESERDGEEAFRWNGDGTRPFPRSERDIERGTFARICRRCSPAEETDKDRGGRSSLEEHRPCSPPRGERKGDEKSRDAKHDRRCRCARAHETWGCEVRRIGKGNLFRSGKISPERRWNGFYAVKNFSYDYAGDTRKLRNRARDAERDRS